MVELRPGMSEALVELFVQHWAFMMTPIMEMAMKKREPKRFLSRAIF